MLGAMNSYPTTHKDWLRITNVDLVTHHPSYRSKQFDRKRRLLSVASAKLTALFLADRRFDEALEACDWYADGVASWNDVKAARRKVFAAIRANANLNSLPHLKFAADAVLASLEQNATRNIDGIYLSRRAVREWTESHPPKARTKLPREFASSKHHEQWLAKDGMDVYSNPFRPVAFDPNWRTSTAVALAQQMYDSRDFGAMPILADALQDACCDNDDILNHCRDASGVHVRGCWVVDLVLGKA